MIRSGVRVRTAAVSGVFLIVFAILATAVLGSVVSAALDDPNVTGEWDASYVSPLGPQELKIYLTQEGPRITGHTTSEFGEFQVRGTITGADVKFSWTEVDGGKNIQIVVTGKIDGETITGRAQIGDRGEGAFKAERTGS